MLLGERKGMEGRRSVLGIGRGKVGVVLPRPQSRGESRGREGKEAPEWQGRATATFRTQNTQVAPWKAQASGTPKGATSRPEAGREGRRALAED